MNQDILIEIIKVLFPAIISSSIVAYYFQRKLQRLQNYKTITDSMMERLLEGMEDVYLNAQRVNTSLANIKSILINEKIDIDELAKLSKIAGQDIGELISNINVHRIYITPLIPFGGSEKYGNKYLATKIGLDYYRLKPPDSNNDKFQEHKLIVLGLIEDTESAFIELQKQITRVKKKIMSGEAVY